MTGRDEIDVMRDLREAVMTLDDPVARLRCVRWLMSVVTDTPVSDRNRGMSDKWRDVMQAIVEKGGTFTTDDVFQAGEASEHKVTRAQSRAQVHHWQKRGWVIEQGDGYELTDIGRSEVIAEAC